MEGKEWGGKRKQRGTRYDMTESKWTDLFFIRIVKNRKIYRICTITMEKAGQNSPNQSTIYRWIDQFNFFIRTIKHKKSMRKPIHQKDKSRWESPLFLDYYRGRTSTRGGKAWGLPIMGKIRKGGPRGEQVAWQPASELEQELSANCGSNQRTISGKGN